MKKEYMENIKLMRYDSIFEALNRTEDDPRSIKAIIEESAQRGVLDRNDGTRKYLLLFTACQKSQNRYHTW